MGISLQDAQQIFSNAGLRTQFGIVLPPGARVAAYVRSTGQQPGDDTFLTTNLCSTLAQGLARARAGLGDFVVVLPGHVENVADATTFSAALVAGTRIIGVGRGTAMPTFTWTQTTSQWAIAVNDVQIAGIRISPIGINGVVLPINITVTDVSISDNEFNAPAVALTGHITVTGAALGLKIFRNFMYNTAAVSQNCISLAAAASDGQISDNRFCVLFNGVASTLGISFGVGSIVKCNQNYCSDQAQLSGILSPGPVT